MSAPQIDFSFINLPSATKKQDIKPFLEHVEKTLIEDLQKYDTFGCRVSDCHTHAGSKLHFSNFIEAELLFHNSYYNKGFAKLTIEHLKKYMLSGTKRNTRNLLLIGYETYSEKYLQELKELLLKEKLVEKCEYCVFEAFSETLSSGARDVKTRIRNLLPLKGQMFSIVYGESTHTLSIDDTLCFFIVPINTSLSTMDKMVAKFIETIADPDDGKKVNREHLCLITLGNGGDGVYFTIEGNKLKPISGKFQYLKTIGIDSFVIIENLYVKSTVAQLCQECFPNTKKQSLTTERPLFNINRGSVVPMVELYAQKPLEPLNERGNAKHIENFTKLIELSRFLTYRHIVRDDNHFQYYIDTERYLQSLHGKEELNEILKGKLKDKLSVELRNEIEEKLNRAGFPKDEQNGKLDERTADELYNKIRSELSLKLSNELIEELIEELDGEPGAEIEKKTIEKIKKELQEELKNELFNGLRTELIVFFKKTKIYLKARKEQGGQVFDYLVAPRHETNAIWVYLINKYVFDEEARIIHLDINKEFRSNIKTKYSDLTASLESISASKEPATIRFHYIDDAIYSGNTFLRAKNLFLSLTKDIGNIQISIFDTIISLISRISPDTKKFYLWGNQSNINGNAIQKNVENHFRSYVNVRLSPMRKYEDACTLCKLRSDYHIIRDQCATNKLADICSTVIVQHQKESLNKVVKICNEERIEDSYIFVISHLINERLSNDLYFEKDAKPINISKGIVQIEKLFELYYNAFNNSKLKELKQYLNLITNYTNKHHSNGSNFFNIKKNTKIKEFIYQVAFIKAISRPFLTFNIRYRQAAFSMCLEKLNELLNSNDVFNCIENALQNGNGRLLEQAILYSFMLQTLVKSLCDMNASFLIRKPVFDKLIKWAQIGQRLCEKLKSYNDSYEKLNEEETVEKVRRNEYYRKNIFTSNSLIHYIKKSIVLSDDETKSLFFENVLLKCEDKFPYDFDSSGICGIGERFCEEQIVQTKDKEVKKEIAISSQGKLYLENNAILKTILSDEGNLEKLIGNLKNPEQKTLYFFENFTGLWKLNGVEITQMGRNNIFHTYQELKERITCFAPGNNGNRRGFSKYISSLFKQITGDPIQALAFVHDESEKNTLFRFFTLVEVSETDKEIFERENWYKDLYTIHAFFHDDNIGEVDAAISSHKEDDLIFITDKLFNDEQKYQKALLVRFKKNMDVEKNEYIIDQASAKDESIYVQIWNFDINNIKHWFALKVLLSLRNDISKLIDAVNLQELIEERKVDMQHKALAINKAATHVNAQKYMSCSIVTETIPAPAIPSSNDIAIRPEMDMAGKEENDEIETIFDPIPLENEIKSDCPDAAKNDVEKFVSYIMEEAKKSEKQKTSEMTKYLEIMKYSFDNLRHKRVLYDRYFQLVTDEVIASFYRRLVKGSKVKLKEGGSLKIDLFSIYDHKYHEPSKTERIMISIPNKPVSKIVNCTIDITFIDDGIDIEFVPVGNIPTFVCFIILSAVNVVLHTNESYLTVEVSKSYIDIRNRCLNYKTQNERNERYWHIPPWLFDGGKDQHITIWTLLHLSGAMNEGGDSIQCKIYYDDSRKEFVTRFEVEKRKVDRNESYQNI